MIKIACLLFLFVVVYYIFKEHSSAFTSLFWKSASSFCFLLAVFLRPLPLLWGMR